MEKGPTWRANGWHWPGSAPLQNLDLVRQLVEEWQCVWSIEWVDGHDQGDGWKAHGNNWVSNAAALEVMHGGILDAFAPASSLGSTSSWTVERDCAGGCRRCARGGVLLCDVFIAILA